MAEMEWRTKYQKIIKQHGILISEIDKYSRDNTKPFDLLDGAKRLQFRLETQINQHIDNAPTPELIQTFLSEKISYNQEVIGGIIYDNVGTSLKWDENTGRGVYNELVDAVKWTVFDVAGFTTKNSDCSWGHVVGVRSLIYDYISAKIIFKLYDKD